ncbi:MAG: DUF2341 domain-containing protein [Candidatus Parvarchaeota archaeon]|nr:DUF2341 domain-containing protein [Candidatus Parvarchaeota archaeon]
MSLNHKSQSALEYMMTYGWAILVIVIVAAVLYSLGIFSPSSSLSTTVTGFANLGTVNAVCLGGTSFTISMGDSTGYPINVTEINLTSSSGKTTYSPNILIQPNSIQTVTVPSSSLCTSGARYSVSAVISYLEPGQIFPGPYTSTGTVAGTANSPPSSATSYETLNITNTQNQGTPSPFQQMINVTSGSAGWGDISSSPFGQNVEFFSSTGQILDSWLENYTSTYAIWWVKLTSSIPAGSKQTIYMGFAPQATNLFNNVNDGEAPQISGLGNQNLPSNILYSQFFFLRPWFSASGPYVYNFTFDPDSPIYHSLLAPNLENIGFFYANGTEIPAMAISNINSTSYDAGSFKVALYLNSVNVYQVILGFASTSTNLNAISSIFSFTPANNYRREAISTVVPNIGEYGKYDDGEYVFQNYTNFSQYYLDEPGCAFSGAGLGFSYGYESPCGNAQSAPIFVSSNLELKIKSGEAVYSYLTPLYPFGSGNTYGYTDGVTLGIERAFYGGDVGNFSAFYSNGTGMNYLISLNESGKNTITQYKTNTSFTNQGYNLYGIGYSKNKFYLYSSGNLYSLNDSFSNDTLYAFIGQDGPFVESKYVFVTNLPPNGVMPSVSFGSVS